MLDGRAPDPGEGYELVVGASDGTEEYYDPVCRVWRKSYIPPGSETQDYDFYYRRKKVAKKDDNSVAFTITGGTQGQAFVVGSGTVDTGSGNCEKEKTPYHSTVEPWLPNDLWKMLHEPMPGEDCYFRDEKYRYIGNTIDGSILLETYDLDPKKTWQQRFETSSSFEQIAMYPFRDTTVLDRKFRVYLIDGRPAIVELKCEN